MKARFISFLLPHGGIHMSFRLHFPNLVNVSLSLEVREGVSVTVTDYGNK